MSSPPTKALFLDIDGVLNSNRTDELYGTPRNFQDMRQFDPVAIGLIRKLCEQVECSIVLSSDWRLVHTVHACANGLDLWIFDRTPYIPERPRGYEIQAWLDEHPEVETYAIVDDNSNMLESQKEFFVQTDGREGLLYSDFIVLRHILMGRPGGRHRNALFWEDND